MSHSQISKLYVELNHEKNINIPLNNLLKKCKDKNNYDDINMMHPEIYSYYKPIFDDKLAGLTFVTVAVPAAHSTDAPLNALNVFSYATAAKVACAVDITKATFTIGTKVYGYRNRAIILISDDAVKEVAAVHAAILVASTGHKGIDPSIPTTVLLPSTNKPSIALGVEIDYSIVSNQVAFLPALVEKDSIMVASRMLELKTDLNFMQIRSDWYSLQYRNWKKQCIKDGLSVSKYFSLIPRKVATRTGYRTDHIISLGKKRVYKTFNTNMSSVIMFKYLNASRGLRQENETGSSGTSASYRYPFFFSKKYVDVLDKLAMYRKIRLLHPEAVIGLDGLDHLEMLYFITNTGDDFIEFSRTRPAGYESDIKSFVTTFQANKSTVIIDFTTTNILYPANSTDSTMLSLFEASVDNFRNTMPGKYFYKPFELRTNLAEYLRFNTEHTGIVMLCNRNLNINDHIDYPLFCQYVILLNHFRNCYALYRIDIDEYFKCIDKPELVKLVPPISFSLEPPHDAIVGSKKKTEYKFTTKTFDDDTSLSEKAIMKLSRKQDNITSQIEQEYPLDNGNHKKKQLKVKKTKSTKDRGKEKEDRGEDAPEELEQLKDHESDSSEEAGPKDGTLEFNPDMQI